MSEVKTEEKVEKVEKTEKVEKAEKIITKKFRKPSKKRYVLSA